jgi:hypothetical protein
MKKENKKKLLEEIKDLNDFQKELESQDKRLDSEKDKFLSQLREEIKLKKDIITIEYTPQTTENEVINEVKPSFFEKILLFFSKK